MHEMSLASALMDEIINIACDNNVVRIEEIELRIGVLKQVVPEVMEEAFRAASFGTLAEGATLRQIEIPARAFCSRCDREFSPAVNDFLCPTCGEFSTTLLEGDELLLGSLTCVT
ncbi:MAG: hydrogenase maturation nickel metallochaperone HypA [Desulfuromonadaceae bacterium]|nr:hydrogenase maturation nickel metallochaperone HypA [Desulfuromonadaceae bacterium]